jgi:hypothetical protein
VQSLACVSDMPPPTGTASLSPADVERLQLLAQDPRSLEAKQVALFSIGAGCISLLG